MPRVQLILWNREQVRVRAAALRQAGYRVSVFSDPRGASELLRALKKNPPAAIVLDLNRAPSLGRDLALLLRETRATRAIPLILVEGGAETCARVRRLLPDATLVNWRAIRGALRRAVSRPQAQPKAASRMDGYSGTPLPKKLGIKPGSIVWLVGAPPDFETTLGVLPEGARLRRRAGTSHDLILWFNRSRRELERGLRKIAAALGPGGLWILWPKQASRVASDLNGNLVRELGLSAGLVDYKIAAIDATWSGLRFTRRK